MSARPDDLVGALRKRASSFWRGTKLDGWAADEIEELIHDIQRHIHIASDLATENEQLRASLKKYEAVSAADIARSHYNSNDHHQREGEGMSKKPTIWIGRYKFGRRTIYAATAASTRKRCQELIDEGPFHNTEPKRWMLTPPNPRGGVKR